ncbi:MAG: hypothetical protein ACREX3_05700 [Gammaproteobacteria bacterium]
MSDDIEDVGQGWQRERLLWFPGEIPEELRDLAEGLGIWGERPSICEQELAKVGFYAGPAVIELGEARLFTSHELSERVYGRGFLRVRFAAHDLVRDNRVSSHVSTFYVPVGAEWRARFVGLID